MSDGWTHRCGLPDWLADSADDACATHAVARRCAEDAQARIASLLRLEWSAEPGAPADAVWSYWSGAVIARLPGQGVLLLEAGLVRAVLGVAARARTEQPVVPLHDAISPGALRVQVELAGCELPLGEVTGLQLGDVIRLQHPVGVAARVCHEGTVLCDGWLARSRGRRAIELARPESAIGMQETR
ncbi:FliM/FliN family flagellar motor switch protein [Ramlibacter sp. USB13]|uniref:FliM/FliN family flagellar motor switch protein n=1 Tax=Ramlibacter cellulosilyticus TaxID=2764187 RepID=A0A923MU75_9BURK|nr:FliM/FliN family flagellar motor C-terminal domain-containing protein [Ramlibacter cellulosilyticus]MBC5785106.1 FliM/FliN family flagellar motor switch protein [Ramlibacter cellulosilyticus]